MLERDGEHRLHSMLIDSFIVPECVYRPGSFTGLMTLYESNFIKLAGLIEPLAVQRPKRLAAAVSVTPHDCDLHLRPVSTERYTTTIKLTYWFESEEGEAIADPDLMVRVYHDARLAEAVRGVDTHQHHKLQELAAQDSPGVHSLELDRRWRNNIMLNKWLDYLLDMGHKFG
jgi:uncharacterized protein